MVINKSIKNKRILIIDDNKQIHLDFKKILLISKREESDLVRLEEAILGKEEKKEDETFIIDCAFQGEDGLKKVKESLKKNEPYAVVFVDVRMPPGWDGIETISRIWKVYPDLQVVICTAYSDYSWEEIIKKLGYSDKLFILKKPFDNIEVRQLTYALSKKWELTMIANLNMSELNKNIEMRTKELSDSEEKYRTLIEHSNDMIWTLDNKGHFAYINKKSENITGHKVKDAIGESFVPLIFEEDLPKVEKVFKKTLQGKPQHYDVRIYDSKKRLLFLSVNTAPIFKKGKMIGTVSFGRDITEQKQAVENLRKNEEKYRLISENTSDLIIKSTFTLNPVFTYVSNSVKSFGYEPEELIGTPCFDIIHPDDKKNLFPLLKKYIKKMGKDFFGIKGSEIFEKVEFRSKDKSGNWHFMESTVNFIDSEILYIARDITERKQLQEEMFKAQKLESIGILAGGIAHDFNNILTSIIGNLSLAKLEVDSKNKLDNILTKIEKSSQQAQNLTQQLLTFARGGVPLKKVISLINLIKNSTLFALRGSNVSGEFLISDHLWPVDVDEGQINQVINNLIINADQAMPGGGVIKVGAENIVIDATQTILIKKGKYVKITIEDHGIGISEDHLQKIFDPYFTTKQKGSGLGLAITYSIIKRHDGYITLESQIGVGTTFHIFLPASKKKLFAKEVQKKKSLQVGKGKVLVMDDEESVRDVAGEMLRRIGCTVELAKNGREASEFFMEAKNSGIPFDIVILDLTVPGSLGGEETIKELIKIDPKAKVIVSSGYSDDPVLSNFRKYGFSGMISKPYRIQELSKVINEVLKVNKE